MDISLGYGQESRTVHLPDGVRVRTLEPPPIEVPPEEPLIRRALEAPVESRPFEEVFRGRRRVTVLVSDKTRSTATRRFLPHLLRALSRAGVSEDRTTLILATGSHSGHSPEEMDQVLGPGVRGRYRVIDHDAGDDDAHVGIGSTSRGTPLLLQREAIETDALLLTGAISFHYFGGFGGGRKSILPGVAHREAVLANHRLMLVDGNLDEPIHPACANGVLEGNPIHEDMVEASRTVGPAFLFNTILSPDGRIAGVVSGDPWEAHRLGVQRVRDLFGVPAENPCRLILASCGGHPKDINFIQAHKSLHHAYGLSAEGGVLVLFGECSQGIGSKDFLGWFSSLDLRSVAARLGPEFTVNGHTAYVTMRKALSRRIILVTALPEETVTRMGMRRATSGAEALGMARETLGTFDEALVLPRASMTVPLPRAKEERA